MLQSTDQTAGLVAFRKLRILKNVGRSTGIYLQILFPCPDGFRHLVQHQVYYLAVDACWEVEPEMAARLAIPLMESTEVRRLTPAAVNVPMFRVISVKL